jgi:L-iditol 2-dehydrogenase
MGNPSGEMRLTQKGYWAILRKELRVSGTWNSVFSGLPENEWRLALDSMASGRLDVKPLISHRVGLEDLPDALVMMRDRSDFFNKVMYVAGG